AAKGFALPIAIFLSRPAVSARALIRQTVSLSISGVSGLRFTVGSSAAIVSNLQIVIGAANVGLSSAKALASGAVKLLLSQPLRVQLFDIGVGHELVAAAGSAIKAVPSIA